MVEPYAGGCGASLQLLFKEFVSDISLNDADARIYAFWRAVLNQTEALVDRIEKATVTLEHWKECRDAYNAPSAQNQIDLAFAVFFLNRCNRSGILMGGGPIGGYEQKGNWKLDARFNRAELISRIRRIADYRSRIKITCFDAIDLLKGLPKDPVRFAYLDPPYFEKGQRLYMNSMNAKNHADLAQFLHSNPPFRWALTYDAAPEIRELYRDFRIYEFSLSYSAAKRRTGSEFLIVDPRLEVAQEIFENNNRAGRLAFVG